MKANDIDEDGDPLTISYEGNVPGVDVKVVSQQLSITLQPGAAERSVIHYSLMDDVSTTKVDGKVLILRLADTAPNRPPVANADAERVVIGNSVKIAVTANDVDPDQDPVVLLSVTSPSEGAGTTAVEGNTVRFTPNLPDITEPTPVKFSYTISDGHGNEATGNVTVTVLVEALHHAPFAADDFGDTVSGKPVTIDVLANDSDPSGGKPSLIADPVCGNGGVAVRTADDRVMFTPPNGATGTYKCKYTVANSQGLRAEASIIVTVTAAPTQNTAPAMDPASAILTVNIGETLTLTAGGLAKDADGDSLVFTSATLSKPEHGSINFTSTTPVITYTAPMVGSAEQDSHGRHAQRVHQRRQRRQHPRDDLDQDHRHLGATHCTTGDSQAILRPASVGDTVPIDVVAELHDQNPNMSLSLTAVSLQSGPGTAELIGGLAVIEPTGPGTLGRRTPSPTPAPGVAARAT